MVQISQQDWSTYLSNYPDAHLLQTCEWGQLKSLFGWDPVRIKLDDGPAVQILFRRIPFGLSLAYLPKPLINNKKYNHQFWAEVDSVCMDHRAIFLKIEPDSWVDSDIRILDQKKMRESPHNIQPPNTIIIDLRGSEEDILNRMKQKTRYNIRLAAKKGVTVRTWDDISSFHKMMQITGKRDGFGVHSLNYFKRTYDLFQPTGMVEMFVAEYQAKPLAALMVFKRGRRAWYVYGASNNLERNRMPTYLLQWEAICWARARGAEEYDLWGIPDEDEETLEELFTKRNDGLWGVYRFKRGFGGELKRASQAVDRVYNHILYWFYKVYMIRKL